MLLATSPGLAPIRSSRCSSSRARSTPTPANGCGACVVGTRPVHRMRAARSDGRARAPRRRRACRGPVRAERRRRARAPTRSSAQRREVAATLDYWNDRDDVYRVYLRAGRAAHGHVGAGRARCDRRSRSGGRGRETVDASCRAGPAPRRAPGRERRSAHRATRRRLVRPRRARDAARRRRRTGSSSSKSR